MAVLSLYVQLTGALGTCGSDLAPERDLAIHREECTKLCNAEGYCCNTNNGGCARPSCTGGCFLAFYSDTQAECEAECDNAAGECWYVPPSEAGKSPENQITFNNCFGHESCGCAKDDEWGRPGVDDCGSGCKAGCRLAANVPGYSFYGRDLTADELESRQSEFGVESKDLSDAIAALTAHMQKTEQLSPVQLTENAQTVERHAILLVKDTALVEAALDLIDAFEASEYGPLWLGPRRGSYFDRSERGTEDYAMITVQQAVFDRVYAEGLARDGLLADCSKSIFEGRRWKTAEYYPGEPVLVNKALADASVVHTAKVHATVPEVWGVAVAFAEEHARRPLGLHLMPGEIAEVTVDSSMVGSGFKVLVGGTTNDNKQKGEHRRMDRVTLTYDVASTTTLIANPLGGALYLLVPYRASLGCVDVEVRGGVVKAPFFQRTTCTTDTDDDWLARRDAPGPWATFETDLFLMDVPRSWVYAKDIDENWIGPTALMEMYDRAMTGIAFWKGYLPSQRNKHIGYLQPDLHIKHGAYGIGYPQVNQLYEPPTRRQYNGNERDGLLHNPMAVPVEYHEWGHAQLTSFYRGELEAECNFLYTFVRHYIFGDGSLNDGKSDSFDRAFNDGMGHSNYMADDAAVHWMITPNFRCDDTRGGDRDVAKFNDACEMDYSHSEWDEFRYQHRGYAKYADITRLFGWEPWTTFYYNEQQAMEQDDFNYRDIPDDQRKEDLPSGMRTTAPRPTTDTKAPSGLYRTDDRTLRWSKVAGFDLSPLIHFWGISPTQPNALRNHVLKEKLPASLQVLCLLKRYRTLIPTSTAEFNTFFDKIYPGCANKACYDANEDTRYAKGWFNVWTEAYGAAEGEKARRRLDEIIELYYGAAGEWRQGEVDSFSHAHLLGESCEGVHTGAPDQPDVARPARFNWMPRGYTSPGSFDDATTVAPATDPPPPATCPTLTKGDVDKMKLKKGKACADTPAGGSCSFKCFKGYTPSGSHVCGADGAWAQLGSCALPVGCTTKLNSGGSKKCRQAKSADGRKCKFIKPFTCVDMPTSNQLKNAAAGYARCTKKKLNKAKKRQCARCQQAFGAAGPIAVDEMIGGKQEKLSKAKKYCKGMGWA